MVFLSRIFNLKSKENDAVNANEVVKSNKSESASVKNFLTNANAFVKYFKEILNEKSKRHDWIYNEGSISFDFENNVFSYFHEVVSANGKVVVDMIDAFEEVVKEHNLPFTVIDFDDEHMVIGLKA